MSNTTVKANGTKLAKAKPTKTIVLRLSPASLVQYPHEASSVPPTIAKDESSSTSIADEVSKDSSPPAIASASAVEVKPETDAASTPAAASPAPQLTVSGKVKKIPGPKPGTKRLAALMNDGTPKPRAKPGPKKRKLDGTLGTEGNRPWTTPAPAAGHKLGPKANQGAINAGLRALDRTGKPCRKWTKRGFTVKSFTGVIWDLPTWSTGKRAALPDLSTQTDTPPSNSENHNAASSNVGSETSRNNNLEPNVAASDSPAPVATSA